MYKTFSFGAILCFVAAILLYFYGDESSSFLLGMACGLGIIPFALVWERYKIKKQLKYEAQVKGEELYYEEIVSLKKGKNKSAWGKLYLTNIGLRFEDRKKEAVWGTNYSDIESIKEKNIFNLHINSLSLGTITISSDDRKSLKKRILSRM